MKPVTVKQTTESLKRQYQAKVLSEDELGMFRAAKKAHQHSVLLHQLGFQAILARRPAKLYP